MVRAHGANWLQVFKHIPGANANRQASDLCTKIWKASKNVPCRDVDR